jgi:hypothetical protein
MIRSRNEHYIDKFENVVTVRSIYGGESAGPFNSPEEAQAWIDNYRRGFDRDAVAYNVRAAAAIGEKEKGG